MKADRTPMLATGWRFGLAASASLLLASFMVSPAAAQAGRNGCYFGECPGGRPAAATTPAPELAPPPDPSKKATPMPTGSSASAPAPEKAAPRKPSGPKVGGSFCKTINDVAGLAPDEFKPITGKTLSSSTLDVTKSLPGADLCAISRRDGRKNYLCFWDVEPKNMAKILDTFVETVNNCFDDSEAEKVGALAHRVSATDEADILVVGDTDKQRVILVISQAKAEGKTK